MAELNPLKEVRAALDRLFGSGADSLRSRTIQGGGLLMIADLYSNAIRLGANLLMTRLLYPEAFGLMLIITLVFSGLAMLSDLGIRGAIIVRKEAVDDQYIRTAWTMGVIRGVILSAIALMLAHPISVYYGQEQLFGLIALVSFTPLIQSLGSLQPVIHEKQVRFARVVFWTCLSQTLGLLVLLAWLLIHPTIWALAANMMIGAAIASIASYLLFPGPAMRPTWHRPSAWEVFSIGRWLFIASGLTFLARQGDSLIVSKWVTAEMLGVFSIALAFAKLVETLIERISWSLLFPVYAELRHKRTENFNVQLRKVKLVMYAICGPLILIFSMLGRDLITVLYDPRYHGAGWMLEIMAAGALFFSAGAAILNIPMSFGDSYRHMWLQTFRFIVLLGVMTAGGLLAGISGLIWGIALAQLTFYPILLLMTRKYGIHDYLPDAIYIGLIGSAIATSWAWRGWPS